VQFPQLGSGDAVEQGGEERAVGRAEARFTDLALQDGQLVAQDQDFEVLVGAGCRQQPEECEHASEGEVGQSQHDGASWCARLLAVLGARKFAGQCLWM
jgi:hypothetical protein